MVKNNTRFPWILLFPFLVFVSCSLDYSQAILPEDLADTVPETVLIKFTQSNVEKRKLKQLIEANKAETFTKSNKTIFNNIHFTQFDSDGMKTIEGKANEVIYQTESKDAEITGGIWFHSYTEKTSIYAESLSWKNKEKRLFSKVDQTVRVVKEDGSFIQGTGFETDLRLKQIIFSLSVSGRFINEKTDKKPATNDKGDAGR
jgi:LPS export ABC transporter protein LptC